MLIRYKPAISQERTAPLLAHYRRRGVPVVEIDMRPDSTPQDVWETLQGYDWP